MNINSTLRKVDLFYKLAQRKMADISDLQNYVDKGYHIHFSDINRLGINPTSEYETPIAVCGYPLNKEIYDQLINLSLPFAQDRPYMHLYRITDFINVKDYAESDFTRDIKLILEKVRSNASLYPEDIKSVDDLIRYSETDLQPKPFSNMWQICRLICSNPVQWNVMLRHLGIKAAVDSEGAGILHSNEPYQSMIFDPTVIDYAGYYISPHYQSNVYKNIHKAKNLSGRFDRVFEDLNPEDKKILYQYGDKKTLLKIIAHPKCDNDALCFIFKNKNADKEVLLKVLKHPECYSNTLYYIVQNQNADKEVLLKVLEHPKCYFSVLSNIAENKNADKEVFLKVFEHPKCDSDILYTITENQNTDKEILLKVLEHLECDDNALYGIFKNKNADKEFLLKVLEYPEYNFRYDITGRSVLSHIAENKNADKEVLLKVLAHPKCNFNALYSIAQNQNADKEVLLKVLEHPECYLGALSIIAKNKNADKEVLLKVLAHPECDSNTLYYIAQNQNADKEVLLKAIEHPKCSSYLKEQIKNELM